MRLWDYRLLPYLPKSQLLSQKRECDLIWKDYKAGKQTNHILINYIHEYSIDNLLVYYYLLEFEFTKRQFKFKDNAPSLPFKLIAPFEKHHNDEYLMICFMNLLEKYKRNQRDFDKETFNKLYNYCDKILNLKNFGVNNA